MFNLIIYKSYGKESIVKNCKLRGMLVRKLVLK